MIQKILVVLVGFIMSVVSALVPSGLYAAPLDDPLASLPQVREESVATVDAQGVAFARVPVLWIEVDGRRVVEDAWGTGDVREIRFKVGVKGVDQVSLAIGDRLLTLHPADVVTIRTFRGDFGFRAVDSAAGTIQLQGAVKTTVLAPGGVETKVRTEAGETLERTSAAGRIAYVVLDTGEKLDTVAVDDGGRRLYTEEATRAAEARREPGNLLADWVKIDGRLVREYTWGDGTVDRIEFSPAETGSGTVVVSFDGKPYEAVAGEPLVVENFVGEHLVYQVAGGKVRLRLDGYAERWSLGGGVGVSSPISGEGMPTAAFRYAPPMPRTTDQVQFIDDSEDSDGIVVFRLWSFGDGATSVLDEPKHRYAKPGFYNVTLEVTDDNLNTARTTQMIHVRNAEPVPDFDFSPKVVNTDTLVTFTDRSFDTDGSIVNWTWDFGDGERSHHRHPSHRFTTSGNKTVTLTVTDDLGGRESLTKVLVVRNAPPLARFNWTPDSPVSMAPVQFMDLSLDKDGTVVDWRWDFGDGTTAALPAPIHNYSKPGVYTVALTVRDDAGDANTASAKIVVQNQAPVVDFVYVPEPAKVGGKTVFTSLSRDLDGDIVLQRWTFEDDGSVSLGSSAQHVYSAPGTYYVALEVIDSMGARVVKRKPVNVEDSAPSVNFAAVPLPALRGLDVRFVDLTTDPDGDALVSHRWTFGDGSDPVTTRNATHRFRTLGNFTVTLNVTDARGKSAEASIVLPVQNAVPVVDTMTVSPLVSVVGAPIAFNATAFDPDQQPGDALVFEWRFSNGRVLTGPRLVHSFTQAGDYEVSLVAKDGDGGTSIPRVERFRVVFPPPQAAFTWSPANPVPDQTVTFTDRSTSRFANITDWLWNFGDGTTARTANATHAFTGIGPRVVTLTVTDENGNQDIEQATVFVNSPPEADFTVFPTGIVGLHQVVLFNDTSSDPGGRIVRWTWDFGDGNASTTQHPRYAFSRPGTFVVRLLVEDDLGATHAAQREVKVQNRPPAAAFSVVTQNPVINQPVTFQSIGSDPDGTAIVGWSWLFGDGGRSDVSRPSHTYAETGHYTVFHRVSDGIDLSEYATQRVRVGSDKVINLVIRAVYPDGRVAALPTDRYELALRHTSAGATLLDVDKDGLVPNGNQYEHQFGVGAVVRGDQLTMTLRDKAVQPAPQRGVLTILSDDVTSYVYTFVIPLPLTPSIQVAASQSAFLGVGGNETSDGTPVYRDAFEPVRGAGRVVYHGDDERPAARVEVIVEARYLGPSLAGLGNASRQAREAVQDDPTVRGLLGWCEVTRASTNDTGHFAWSHRGVLCTKQLSDGSARTGPLASGWYEVRAIAKGNNAITGDTGAVRFVVDPTGAVVPMS